MGWISTSHFFTPSVPTRRGGNQFNFDITHNVQTPLRLSHAEQMDGEVSKYLWLKL